MESNVNFKYYAFISYSHEDEEYAKRIQKKLTEYKLPSVIRKANPLLPDNVRPIFRDATNLTTGMLQGTLNSELEHSKFLIVLCSPNSAKPNDENKHWVNKEVQHFIDLERAEFIIPVIVGGEPHATNPEEECFCPALLSLSGGDELLGIDIRKNPKKKIAFGKSIKRKLGIPDEDDLEEKGIVHIVAKMLGLDIDDLWDWNKKAQKRKAYEKLFSAAAVFVLILSVGLTVYFKKFHVYHEYYVDYVERAVKKQNGTDIEFIGLGRLSKKEIRKRECHFRFDYMGGKLRNIINENSAGIPKPINQYDTENKFNLELIYDRLTGNLDEVLFKNELNSIIMKYVYKQDGNVIDIESKNGSPIGIEAKSNGILKTSIWDNKADIKSYKIERDRNGYIIKKMYYRYHGAESPSKDSDGIAGFEYILDNLGRPIQTWYLGLNNNNFERQSNKNGIAGLLTEYDDDFNGIKTIFINSDGKPEYNPSYASGVTIVLQDFENGNLVRQSYQDADGNPCSNSNGIYFYCKEYDNYGNCISISSFDKNGNYINSEDYYSIQKFKYDKNGNIIEISYYDVNNELCIIKGGIAKVKYKYNSLNQVIEFSFFDIDDKSILYMGEYSTKTFSYNNAGDIESECFYDEYGNPCYISEGAAKYYYVFNENHKIEEIYYYDKDFESLINNSNNYAKVIYKYDKLGNWIESRYFDINGNLVNDTEGICITKRCFDNTGNLIEEFYYDLNYSPITLDDGYFGIEYEYDDFGNLSSKKYIIDEDRNLCDTKYGYSFEEYEYDNKGNLKCLKKFDSKRNPIKPYCMIKYEYNDDNNEIKQEFYDNNNKLVKNELGYAKREQVYKKGLIIRQSFFDEFGNYCLCDNSHAISTCEYDNYGRVIERSCYDTFGRLINNSDTYSTIRYKYDYNGNTIETAFYENFSNLISCNALFAIERLEYDKNNNLIQCSYYDEDDNPVITSAGYSIKKMKYDARRKCIYLGYFDEKSESINAFDNWKFFSYVIYDSNKHYEPTYYDKNGMQIQKNTYVAIAEIFPESKADNSLISPWDILIKWNEWEYDPLNPKLDFLGEQLASSADKNKYLVLYNLKENNLYTCVFNAGLIGVRIVDWPDAILAGFQENFNSYLQNKELRYYNPNGKIDCITP